MAKRKRKTDWEAMHRRNVNRYQREIEELYEEAARQCALLGGSVGTLEEDMTFAFDRFPELRRRAERIVQQLYTGVYGVIVDGIDSEWTLANNKNSELARMVFGDNIGKLTKEQYARYFSTNGAARDAFVKRKVAGMNLSQRVWKYSEQFKSEMETVLDVGIHSGRSADGLAQDLQEYLKYPDKLFRRVRTGVDENGNPIYQLSKAASEFHPGQGVYRSSYKNARRLAGTETNIAYRTADYERWQDMDFVVGIRICLSNNHTLNGKPFTDICDELKGNYPKDFKFTGWHPQCRCHVETILKTREEMEEDFDRILAGEDPQEGSVNEVKDVPEGFKKWLEDNQERAAGHYSMPYFIKDNLEYVPFEFLKSYGSRLPYDTFAEYEQAMRYNRKNAGFTKEIKGNNSELNKSMPVMQGKVMNVTEADKGKCNPTYGEEDAGKEGYQHNCQTCTMTYEARRRGFNVKAKPNPESGTEREFDAFCRDNNTEWTERFLNADGTKADYTWSRTVVTKDTVGAKKAFIESCMTETGRYEVYCVWKGKGDVAHVFIVEKQADGNLMWYDPQTGEAGKPVEAYVRRMRMAQIGVMRIDNKLINPKFVERFEKS